MYLCIYACIITVQVCIVWRLTKKLSTNQVAIKHNLNGEQGKKISWAGNTIKRDDSLKNASGSALGLLIAITIALNEVRNSRKQATARHILCHMRDKVVQKSSSDKVNSSDVQRSKDKDNSGKMESSSVGS